MIILQRQAGPESYPIEKASMYILADTLWFDIEGGTEGASYNSDTRDSGMYPVIELGVPAPALAIEKLSGQEFFHQGIEAEDEDSCNALIYYFEHEPIFNAHIKILAPVAPDQFQVSISFTTNDIVDGNLGPITVHIDGPVQYKTN